jgi:hypothetical protein
MPVNDRKINAPFMLPVSEKYNEMGSIVVGKIESGRVKKGDSLLLMPNKVRIAWLAPSPSYTSLTLDAALSPGPRRRGWYLRRAGRGASPGLVR